MKSIKIFGVLVLIVAIGAAFKLRKEPKPNAADKGFAVIELFTSEGCSSCPPADALIAKVQKESAGKPIYILAFHVDYWDRLGWKDVFSDAAYTARQKQYSHLLKSELYTPQAIVNGKTEFVGSEEANLRNAIKNGLASAPKMDLSLSDVKVEGDKATLQYHAVGDAGHASLLVALVEKNATSKVARGENAGRTLSHVQIVRKLQSVPLGVRPNGMISIALPAGFSPEGAELIAFTQNTSTGEITGATRAEFTGTMSAGTK